MEVQYHNYKRLTFVAHHPRDLERYRAQALEVAAYCQRWGMRYQELLGSEQYVRRLAETAAAIDAADENFIVTPPGGELKQRDFIRT